MSDALLITHDNLAGLIGDLLGTGAEVIAPVAVDGCASPAAAARAACLRPGVAAIDVQYRYLPSPDKLSLGAGMPSLSLKGFFLPQNEALFRWRQHGTEIDVEPAALEAGPRVVIGAKPCDSAALEIVDEVMNWDLADELWNARRAATTILNLACPVEDESCFCGAVGLQPDSTRGADGLLTPVAGGFLVEATTDKGQALLDAHQGRLAVGGDAGGAAVFRESARAKVAANLQIDVAAVRDWIDSHFDDPLLTALGVRCNGCGACASVCPTCHCFDIVDETDGIGCGTRRRSWDTCQTGKFTAHASGHNPREDQNVRFRQRINHKFAIYPLRFGEVLCTGCGRCTRACHAGQDLVEILSTIDIAARRGEPAQAVPAAGGGSDGEA